MHDFYLLCTRLDHLVLTVYKTSGALVILYLLISKLVEIYRYNERERESETAHREIRAPCTRLCLIFKQSPTMGEQNVYSARRVRKFL